jgi:hypothetical protein
MHELGQHVFCGPRVPDRTQVVYRAGKRMGVPVPGTSPVEFRTEWRDDFQPATWRRGNRMPRWASRLTLEITDLRVQRLQQISEEDAMAQGAPPVLVPPDGGSAPHVEGFRDWWDRNAGGRPGWAWADNPWVWALTFRRVAS